MSVPTDPAAALPANPAPSVRLGIAAAGRCRRRIHLDHDPDMDRALQRPPDPGLRLRFDTLEVHRRSVLERLAANMTVRWGLPGAVGLSADPDAAAPIEPVVLVAAPPTSAAGSAAPVMPPALAAVSPAPPTSAAGSIVSPASAADLSVATSPGVRPQATDAPADRRRPADGSSAVRPAAILGSRLTTAMRTGIVDILLATSDGGYAPVLVRGHRTTDPGDGAWLTPLDELSTWTAAPRGTPASRRKLRAHHHDVLALAHAYRMLQELSIASGEKIGGIVGLGASSSDPTWDDGQFVAWHRLDAPSGGAATALADYDARFTDRWAVANAAAHREPALAQPSRVSECGRCPWWTVCGPALEAAHDVSLLVAGGDVNILRTAGAQTYDDVARMPAAALSVLPLTGIPAGEARIRARAMVANVPMVRRAERADVVRADVEFDVDMESYLDDGAYLWGTYLSGEPIPGFDAGYRPFVTWDSLDKPSAATNFVAFWRYMTALRAECARLGRSFAAYCYSHKAEERWLYGTPVRFPDEPGMPTRGDVAAFCTSPQWVDLYQEVKRLFIVPGSLRLKAVAPIAGFAWRDSEPGGENSMAWYRRATGTPSSADGGASRGSVADRGATDLVATGGRATDLVATGDGAADDVAVAGAGEIERNRKRILRYNEDDVLATLRLRQWISDNPTAMPTVAELAARHLDRS